MTTFLLFCIATVGMTSIITQGVIFMPIRQYMGNWAESIRSRREQKALASGKLPRRSLVEWFNELINCAQCTGFWCGLFCGMILLPWSGEVCRFFTAAGESPLLFLYFLLTWFCCGLGGSFLAALGCIAIDWVFYLKMNALRQWEDRDSMLAAQHTHSHLPETHE